MPPKKKTGKKSEPKEPVGYDVSIMTLDQLKQYAKLLQSEIEDMRKHCNFYQKVEDELVELLEVTEDNLSHTEDTILSKDVDLERLKLKFLKHLRDKKQRLEYTQQVSCLKKEKLSSDTCDSLEQEQERHLKETERLKAILNEKDQQLEALRVKTEMARRETIEMNESYLAEMDKHQEELLEEAISRFEDAAKETQEEFKQALENIKLEAKEDKMQAERAFNATCESLKRKLQNYYKEVTKQDLDSIRKLKEEIKQAEQKIASSKLQLRQALEENRKLKGSKFKNPIVISNYNVGPLKMMEALKTHKRTEQLALENQNLEEQIKNVRDQIQNLRSQFTRALTKVRDSAEMKAAFLEKKLIYISEEKQKESVSRDPENESITSGYTTTETGASDISEYWN